MTVYTVDHTPGGTAVRSCECGKEWLAALNAKGRELGLVKEKFDILQGGYRHGATSASAGTHDGGGAFDFADFSDKAVTLFRQMGGAAWHRTVAQGFSGPHCHCILVGCPHHPSADYQVTAYRQGYNGLGNGGRKGVDDGPQVSPIRTYAQGITWANSHRNELFTVAQYDELMKAIKDAQNQAHYDAGSTQKLIKSANQNAHHDAGSTQKAIAGIPAKVVNGILGVKWGDSKENLGTLLTDLRKRFYGSK